MVVEILLFFEKIILVKGISDVVLRNLEILLVINIEGVLYNLLFFFGW